MKKNFAKMIAVILSVSTAVTMSAGTIFADTADGISQDTSDGASAIEADKSGAASIEADIPDEETIIEDSVETEQPAGDTGASALPEWAVPEDGFEDTYYSLLSAVVFPARFDMRDQSWVTPVRFQNPWGTCWAFGGIAAAETSLLSSGLAAEYGYDNTTLNLSERHLTWFVYTPITENENPAQAGEGLTSLMYKDAGENAPFASGGMPVYVSGMFASGAGPVLEESFPYWGKEKWTNATDPTLTLDDKKPIVEKSIELTAAAIGKTPDEEYQMMKQKLEEEVGHAVTDEEFYDYYYPLCVTVKYYSRNDDWTIPAVLKDGYSARNISAGWVLKNGNTFPDYWTDKDNNILSDTSMRAMKQELLNGRGIEIGYAPTQDSDIYNVTADFNDQGAYGEGIYGGISYAHYVDDPNVSAGHAVCIVGWDDSFSAKNFTEGHQPPADGAWIVRNSWGSESDASEDPNGNVVNFMQFGAYNKDKKTTGYFYLSYYDKSIADTRETFEFSSNLNGMEYFAVDQYDYLPAQDGYYSDSRSTVMSTANVFTAEENMDLTSVSTRTENGNTRVTCEIRLLNADAQAPDEGDVIYKRSTNFQYGGFHRIDLDHPIRLNVGDKYSVICTSSMIQADGSLSYEICANEASTKDVAVAHEGRSYGQKVINPGESFLFYTKDGTDAGKWYDWKDESAAAEAAVIAKGEDAVLIDNFSIKAYSVPVNIEIIDISEPLIKGIEDKPYTGAEITQEFTVSVGGRELSEGTDYEVSYKDNINAGTASVIITGINGYTGSVTRTFRITPVTLKASDVTLKTTSYTYNGKAKSPAVTVKSGSTVLKKGTDYTVKYTNNTNPGTATATVTGKGNYTGTVKKTYKILPKGTEITSVEPGKQQATIQWKKQAVQTTGYNIQYSTKKDFSSGNVSLTVKDKKTIQKTIKNLKSGKQYYVRIRTYKTVSGKKYYSKWSKTKAMKAK